jgi:hypothetical protein
MQLYLITYIFQASSFPYVFSFANHSILFYKSIILISEHMEKVSDKHLLDTYFIFYIVFISEHVTPVFLCLVKDLAT